MVLCIVCMVVNTVWGIYREGNVDCIFLHKVDMACRKLLDNGVNTRELCYTDFGIFHVILFACTRHKFRNIRDRTAAELDKKQDIVYHQQRSYKAS